MTRVLATAAVVAIIATSIAGAREQAVPPANSITIMGEVTAVFVDLETIVVTVGGRDLIVPCAPGAAAACAQLAWGDQVQIEAHFGDAQDACNEVGLINPIVIDHLWRCEKVGACEELGPEK